MAVTLKQRTYLDRNGKAVSDSDRSRVYLLGPKGRQVSKNVAERAGLVDGAFKAKAAPKAANKAAKPDGDKGE